jgi:hypothetical protein
MSPAPNFTWNTSHLCCKVQKYSVHICSQQHWTKEKEIIKLELFLRQNLFCSKILCVSHLHSLGSSYASTRGRVPQTENDRIKVWRNIIKQILDVTKQTIFSFLDKEQIHKGCLNQFCNLLLMLTAEHQCEFTARSIVLLVPRRVESALISHPKRTRHHHV